MEEPRTTRSRIVDAAADLFHLHGFKGTSLTAVQAAADVRAGSLYYFFKTKEELAGAALERYAQLLGPTIMEPAFAGTEDPLERVFRILTRYRELLLETDFGRGCPVGNLALEMGDAGPEVRLRLVANFNLWATTVEQCLIAAAHQLPRTDLRRLARFVLTIMEGAVLLSRGQRDIRPLDDAIAQLRDYFGRMTAARVTSTERSSE